MHLNHPQTIPLSLVRENIEETGPWCKKKGWRRLLYRLVSYTTARVVFYNSESKPRTELGTGGSPCNLLWRRCGFKGVVFYMLIRIDPGQEQWWRSGCRLGAGIWLLVSGTLCSAHHFPWSHGDPHGDQP